MVCSLCIGMTLDNRIRACESYTHETTNAVFVMYRYVCVYSSNACQSYRCLHRARYVTITFHQTFSHHFDILRIYRVKLFSKKRLYKRRIVNRTIAPTLYHINYTYYMPVYNFFISI